jgi:hypothetical protein
MGFFSGRVTFLRFQVHGRSPRQFGPQHLEKLATHVIGRQRIVSADGIEVGWTAGEDILDTDFDLAKNIVNDTLHFALRIDTQKLPSDLLQAYYRQELKALAAGNPSGHPSGRQKREARDSARERLEQEAADGRFLRRKAYPVLWDVQANELLVGTKASTALERLHGLFQETFGAGFELVGAGRRAYLLAELREQTRGVDDARATVFVPNFTYTDLAWVLDETSRDFLGNEFLLWLWFVSEVEGDTLKLADDSEVTLMLARNLVLECPRGQTGRETIHSEGPSRLPEAKRAVQAGKLPRQVGLTLVRHDRQYELTLAAETLGVTSAKLPESEADEERARQEERIDQLRQLVETLDLLYDAFGRRRFGGDWPKELARLQKWLQRPDRTFATARVAES